MKVPREGWEGWDQYAPVLDWENAETLGRRDIPFWRRLALRARRPCPRARSRTGRVRCRCARAGVRFVGSIALHRCCRGQSAGQTAFAPSALRRISPKLAPLIGERRRKPCATRTCSLCRATFARCPSLAGSFRWCSAPYGVLQSLLDNGDLAATPRIRHHVLVRNGAFGIDLDRMFRMARVQYRVQLRGRRAGSPHLTLIEWVDQDRKRRLTRSNSAMWSAVANIESSISSNWRSEPAQSRKWCNICKRTGFRVEALLGDYRGHPWDERADVWIILARRW